MHTEECSQFRTVNNVHFLTLGDVAGCGLATADTIEDPIPSHPTPSPGLLVSDQEVSHLASK